MKINRFFMSSMMLLGTVQGIKLDTGKSNSVIFRIGLIKQAGLKLSLLPDPIEPPNSRVDRLKFRNGPLV